MGITEFFTGILKPGTNISDPNSPAAQLIADILQNTVFQQEGVQRGFVGQQLESPNVLNLFIDWDTLEHHVKFTKISSYGPMLKRLETILDAPPVIYHVQFHPYPAGALSNTQSPVTEVLVNYHKPDISDDDKKSAVSNLRKVIDVIENNAKGCRSHAGGWAIEEKVPSSHGEAKAFVSVIGWESKEAHMAFRETQTFKDNIHYLRESPALLGMEMFHVSFSEIQAGGKGGAPGSISAGANTGAQEEVLNPQAGPKVSPATTNEGNTTKYTT